MRTRRRSIREIFTFFENTADEYRIVEKDGDTTIKVIHQPGSKNCFYPNVYISIVELSSKWICLIFLTCFLLSWFTFALLYFVVSEANEDFPDESETLPQKTTYCITGVHDFQAMFLFSMETQTTIGYGSRYVTEECPTTMILVIIQSIVGSILLSILTGVVLFKFQEPKKRAHTVLFSKVACVYEEDGKYYIEVQILNMQRSQVIDPKVTAVCVMNKEDGSGKFRFDMDFKPYQNNSKLFFRPRVYRHIIDYASPFWDFNRVDFEKGAYEIIAMLNGVDEFTDTFVQVRTSYLPSEVMWSRYFKTMSVARIGNLFKLNFNDFTQTNPSFDMSDDSASVASSRRASTVVQPELDSRRGLEYDVDDINMDYSENRYREIDLTEQMDVVLEMNEIRSEY